LLEARALHLWRADSHVLRGLSFRLAPGQALQLLWPNGAGKTTLLRAVAGLLPLESGQVLWCGEPVEADQERFHRGIAYLGHELALKGDLGVLQNLQFALALREPVAEARVLATLVQVGLQVDPREKVRRLSAGQQRRVALARLMLWQAQCWLLDEPVANLDAAGQSAFRDAILAHLEAGGCALISTHQPLDLPAGVSRSWHSPTESA
jgi:heme exporter protein A